VLAAAVARDKVANVLLARRGRGQSNGTVCAAEDIARATAKELLGPLLDTACARLGFVLRRSFEIAAERTQLTRGARAVGLACLLWLWPRRRRRKTKPQKKKGT
jgi:hypothetical protein